MQYTTFEGEVDIQVVPDGEEHFHIPGFECGCDPTLESFEGIKLVYVHNSMGNMGVFDHAYWTPLHTVRQEIDC